jgi:hypothetical protein
MARDPGADHGERLNPYHRLEVAVFGMEVRRAMIAEVHLDDDAMESTDLRHPPTPSARPETLRPALFPVSRMWRASPQRSIPPGHSSAPVSLTRTL